MVVGCFAASGTGQLAVTDSTMISASYQILLEENAGSFVRKFRLTHRQTFQEENDPKHNSKPTKGSFKKKKLRVYRMAVSKPRFESHCNVVGGFETGSACDNPR